MRTSTPSDPFTIYEVGIDRLLDFLGGAHSDVSDVLVFQQRLLENIASARQYGDTETLRHERARIIDQINALAQAVGGPLLPVVRSRPRATTIEQRNRSRMLEKVRITWIKGVLEKSLHNEVLIALNMEERPDAVTRPWDMVLREQDRPNRMLPSGTKIIDVFDEVGGELLILGAPGSGKTTMLLELARDLIARAEQDETYPMPTMFNLSSWARERKPIIDWVVDELNTKYDIPKKIGKTWVDSDQVLPLLDGLDEVKQEQRIACVDAINHFRQEHGLVNIAVSSRVADYEVVTERLKLQGAVLIHPLTTQQIDAYLATAGDQLQALRAALSEDVVLRELAKAPLMLSSIILVYRGVPADGLVTSGTVEEQRKRLFAAYVDRMFARRGSEMPYTPQETLRGLMWLARSMVRQGESMFFIERLQLNWLPVQKVYWHYVLLDRVGWGVLSCLLFGLIVALVFGIANAFEEAILYGLLTGPLIGLLVALFGGSGKPVAPSQPRSNFIRLAQSTLGGGLVIGLVYGLSFLIALGVSVGDALVGGLVFGLIGALTGALAGSPGIGPRFITIIETISWSWRYASRAALGGMCGGMLVGAITLLGNDALKGLFFQLHLPFYIIFGPELYYKVLRFLGSFTNVLTGGITGGLLLGCLGGFVNNQVEETKTPNQGIRRSGRSAIRSGLLGGAILGAVGFWISGATISLAGIILGLIGFVIAGLSYGGQACLSHLALRIVLSRSSSLPLRLAPFLDYCADRIFLRKVGGGYIFIHRMLMEYFAELDTQSLDKQSPGAHSRDT